MNAKNTSSRTYTMSYSRAAVSAAPRQPVMRFWLIVYALLLTLIALALAAAGLLFWWDGYIPAVAAPYSEAPLPGQPVYNQPAATLPDQSAGEASESASAQPTQVQPTPVVTTPQAIVVEPIQVEPVLEEIQIEPTPLPVEPAVAQPTEAETVLETTPAVEPTAIPELVEEPTNRQIYLGLEDDYHWQLSVPNGSSACGPTALLIALDYYDLASSLPDLIAQASFDPLEGGYDPTCTTNAVCTSPQALAKLASEEYGLDVQSGEGWTFDQVTESLQAGSPVIADIAWDPSRTTLGHFVVIYGIDPDNRVVYYHDPYYGAGMSATWDEFEYRWSKTVDVGDPLQAGGYTRWAMAIFLR